MEVWNMKANTEMNTDSAKESHQTKKDFREAVLKFISLVSTQLFGNSTTNLSSNIIHACHIRDCYHRLKHIPSLVAFRTRLISFLH